MTYEELKKLDDALDHDAGPMRPRRGQRIGTIPSVAVGRLLERRPDCIYTYGVRIGYKAVYRFGSARIPEDDEC